MGGAHHEAAATAAAGASAAGAAAGAGLEGSAAGATGVGTDGAAALPSPSMVRIKRGTPLRLSTSMSTAVMLPLTFSLPPSTETRTPP